MIVLYIILGLVGVLVLVGLLMPTRYSLGAKTTAEGVETAQQLDVLRRLKCDEAQGYGIAYPMPVDAATRWLQLFTPQQAAVEGYQAPLQQTA